MGGLDNKLLDDFISSAKRDSSRDSKRARVKNDAPSNDRRRHGADRHHRKRHSSDSSDDARRARKKSRDKKEQEIKKDHQPKKQEKKTNAFDLFRRRQEKRYRALKTNNDLSFVRVQLESPERVSLWDLPPSGYEHLSVLEFKKLRATGALPIINSYELFGEDMFNRVSFLNLPPPPPSSPDATSIMTVTEDSVKAFVLRLMVQQGYIKENLDESSIFAAFKLNKDGTCAVAQFKTTEMANAALNLDGALFTNSYTPIKVRKPVDYQPPSGMFHQGPGSTATTSADSLNKLFIANIPLYLNDEQVLELLSAFGEVKSFNLVKDTESGMSKGYCFVEYVDQALSEIALQALNNMEIGDRRLVVQRAVLGSRPTTNYSSLLMGQLQIPGIDANKLAHINNANTGSNSFLLTAANSVNKANDAAEIRPTEVLCLLNMVVREELINDDDYEDIVEDIELEVSKYGNLLKLVIPRPVFGQSIDGVEKVFLQYETVDEAKNAYAQLAGRKFADRILMPTYYDSAKFAANQL